MITEQTLTEGLKSRLEDLTLAIEEAKAEFVEELKLVDNLGGLVDRNEAIEILGISGARFSQLMARDQFRQSGMHFSLADVNAYKKNRKNGRPPR